MTYFLSNRFILHILHIAADEHCMAFLLIYMQLEMAENKLVHFNVLL